MRLDWRFREPGELEYGKPPPVWIAVALTIVVFAAGFVITVLTWGKGQSVVSVPFVTRALLIPLAISGLVSALVYAGHEDAADTVDMWNFLCARSRVRWQAWSQARVAILDSVTFTPEKDLAERMLGLEGNAPRNEGKTLPLSMDEAAGEGESMAQSGTRQETVLEKLVTPFVPLMTRLVAKHAFHVVLQSEDEDSVNRLHVLLRKLDISGGRINVKRAEAPLDAALIHQWLNDGVMPDFCLVLACQLHQYGQEARCSEAAVGLLFAREDVMNRYRSELRPQAYVFQPVSAAPDSVSLALRGMLQAQRMPSGYVRHLWLGALPKQARHAAEAASEAAALKVAAHDVDLAIGRPGSASAMLAQALAAEMVQHGQGTQLVATSGGAGILLNLVGTEAVAIPAEPQLDLRYLRPWRIVAIACMSGLLACVLDMTQAPGSMFILVPGLFTLALLMEAWGAQARYGAVEASFYGGR
jgi:hypothetical protein